MCKAYELERSGRCVSQELASKNILGSGGFRLGLENLNVPGVDVDGIQWKDGHKYPAPGVPDRLEKKLLLWMR